MRLRTILIVVFAVVFALSASVGAYLLERRPEPEKVAVDMVSVVVARTDVSRGQTLTREMLTNRNWPKDAVPEGVLSDLAAGVDRTVVVPIVSGELLMESKLAPRGAGHGLAAIIPHGMRAYTIQTPNIATGVAGFILPGNKVDVLLSISSQAYDDVTGGGSTVTLLQNVEILAVDQRVEAPQENKMDPKELRSITLMVTPGDAAKLDLGQNKGTLHLSLRNPEDEETAAVEPSTLSSLRIGMRSPESEAAAKKKALPPEPPARKEPPPPPPKPKYTAKIRTLRGSQPGFVTFESPDAEEADVPPGPRATKPTEPDDLVRPEVP